MAWRNNFWQLARRPFTSSVDTLLPLEESWSFDEHLHVPRPGFDSHIQMQEESAIGVARVRIRQLVSVKGHRGSLLRAALCLVG